MSINSSSEAFDRTSFWDVVENQDSNTESLNEIRKQTYSSIAFQGEGNKAIKDRIHQCMNKELKKCKVSKKILLKP